MEFKVGNQVKVSAGESSPSKKFDGQIGTIIEVGSDWCRLDIEKTSGGGLWKKEITLIDSTGIPNIKMSKTKKVFKVLVVNKKTSKEEKTSSTVVADSEQQATLKAFGVDVDNLFIKVEEVGEYQEEKPVEVVSVDGKNK